MNNSFSEQVEAAKLAKEKKRKMKIYTFGGGAAFLVLLIVMTLMYSTIWGSVDSTEYHVKQTYITGSVSVKSEPGNYIKLGNSYPYSRFPVFYFSKDKLDGGDSEAAKPLGVTFMGNGTADVSGIIKVRLPVSDSLRKKLHRDFGSEEAVVMDLIRNTVAAALKQTGPLFRPEESITNRRSEFESTLKDILTNGKFATVSKMDTISQNGKAIVLAKSVIKLDSNGQPVILSRPIFREYGMTVELLEIKDIDFDPITDKLIKTKKESEQKIIAARADAEKAKQDTKTAVENGKALVAKAEAEALVLKKTAVVNAEKEAEVAKQNKIRDELNAKAKLAIKKAEAEGDRLKVQAGLSPQEKAEFDMKTSIGVAEALSKWVGPKIVTTSGSGKGGSGSTMMDALAIKQMMGIASELNK